MDDESMFSAGRAGELSNETSIESCNESGRADRADKAHEATEASKDCAGGDEALHMHKRVERKEDGRHLLYYSFGKEVQLPSGSE